jgi:16S rRNA (adenine1518-N6/adenine1519-N6)-dimethyltransferase
MGNEHIPKKSLGQHFLHDPHVLARLVASIDPKLSQHIIEIGPGEGVLTALLLPHVARLDAIEFDRDLIPKLEANFGNNKHFHLHHQDALTIDYAKLAQQELIRIVGNLPYQISTPLLFYLLRFSNYIIDMHFLLQREVVARMVANPGSKDYGRLSIMTQYFCATEALFIVSPGAFYPPPKVVSQVIRLIHYQTLPYQAHDFKLFEQLVRDTFNMRRKQLKNSLAGYEITVDWESLNLSPTQRPEELTVADFVRLANHCRPV